MLQNEWASSGVLYIPSDNVQGNDVMRVLGEGLGYGRRRSLS